MPAAVPRTVLAGTAGIHNAGRATPHIGFILHQSADLGRVLRVVSLPAGAAESITRLETINVPGQPTGTLFISGTAADSRAQGVLARLDQNFVTGAPTGLLWVYNVWGEVYVADSQPWDVGSDGRLVFVTGQSHGADWCATHALNGTTGQLVPIANWRTHWLANGAEFQGVAAAPGGLAAVSYSGYRAGPAATYGVTSVAIDRRSNDCYLGFNVQTVLPGGQPDFEPAVLALPWLRPAACAGGAASTTKSRPPARPSTPPRPVRRRPSRILFPGRGRLGSAGPLPRQQRHNSGGSAIAARTQPRPRRRACAAHG